MTRLTLIATGFAVLASACASGPIEFNLQHNRLDVPETYGTLGAGRVHLGHASSHKTLLTPDYGTVLVANSKPEVTSVATYAFGGGIGILDRLDIDIKTMDSAPTIAQLKLQILGKNRREAEPGNFCLTVTAGSGDTSNSASVTNYDLFTNSITNGPAKYDFSQKYWDGSVILGYRTSLNALLYASFALAWTEVQGKQTLYSGTQAPFRSRAARASTRWECFFLPPFLCRSKTGRRSFSTGSRPLLSSRATTLTMKWGQPKPIM